MLAGTRAAEPSLQLAVLTVAQLLAYNLLLIFKVLLFWNPFLQNYWVFYPKSHVLIHGMSVCLVLNVVVCSIPV